MRRALLTVLSVSLSVACGKPAALPPKAESIAKGDQLFAEKRFSEAASAYNLAVAADGRDGDAYLRLARAYQANAKWTEAVRAGSRAADLLSASLEAQLFIGDILLGQARFTDAATYGERATAIAPSSAAAHVLLGNAKAQLRGAAVAWSTSESFSIELGVRPIYSSLRSMVPAEDDVVAEQHFREAIRAQPDNQTAHIAYANFLWVLGRFEEAETELKAAAIDANNWYPYWVLGRYYIALGRPGDAERYLRTAADHDADSAVILAELLVNDGRTREASALVTRLPTNGPTALAATRIAAAIAFREGRRDDALKQLDTLLAAYPLDTQALLLKSQVLAAGGAHADALKAARMALSQAPNSFDAHLAIADLLLPSGDAANALTEYVNAARLKPSDVRAQRGVAKAAIAMGRGAEAVAAARQAARSRPDDVDIAVTLVRALVMTGDLDAARKELTPLLSAHVSADLLAMQGRIESELGNSAQARTFLNRALALDPHQPDALEASIDLDLAQRNSAAAQEQLEKLMQVSAGTVQAQLVAARVHAARGDSAKQEAALRQALSIDSADSRPVVRLAPLLSATGRAAEAEQLLQGALKTRPEAPDVMSTLAAHYERAGRAEEAKTLYQRLVGLYPDVAIHKYRLAALMVERGDNLDVALTFASDARKQAPNDAEAADVLGWVYIGKNLPTLAVPHLADAVKLAPGRALFHYHLGFAYVRLDRRTQAEAELETSLRLDPKFEQAERARAALEQLRRSRRS